ncbi:MAG: endo-1,4-beta-xylanase [Prolixibacteraceae bacterium]
MRKNILLISTVLSLLVWSSCSSKVDHTEKSLKQALAGKFYIGVALNTWQTSGEDSLVKATIVNNFSSIVAENCMKSESLQPIEGEFNFEMADDFVDFGEKNEMFIIGHCLVWHAQAPAWFFTDAEGNDVSREVMIDRMKSHISTVVGRYKGRVDGWDVVNEAFNEDGTLRDSKFLQIIGDDYIQLAFEFAHEADPDAELYYNEYNMYKPEKLDGVLKVVKSIQENGVRIDGVGMQAHISLVDPTIEQYETSVNAVAALGLKTSFTELDISVLPWPEGPVVAEISTSFELQKEFNPYPDGLPDSLATALTERYASLFEMFLKNSDKIERVTLWGLSDATTWRNDWPVQGRTDYPLLFDRQYTAKPAVEAIIELTTEK